MDGTTWIPFVLVSLDTTKMKHFGLFASRRHRRGYRGDKKVSNKQMVTSPSWLRQRQARARLTRCHHSLRLHSSTVVAGQLDPGKSKIRIPRHVPSKNSGHRGLGQLRRRVSLPHLKCNRWRKLRLVRIPPSALHVHIPRSARYSRLGASCCMCFISGKRQAQSETKLEGSC